MPVLSALGVSHSVLAVEGYSVTRRADVPYRGVVGFSQNLYASRAVAEGIDPALRRADVVALHLVAPAAKEGDAGAIAGDCVARFGRVTPDDVIGWVIGRVSKVIL